MAAAARRATSLCTAAASAAFSNDASLFQIGDRNGAEKKLASLSSAGPARHRRLRPSRSGERPCFGSSAAGSAYIGLTISDFFPEVSTIRSFGDHAGVIETTIDGAPYYAAISLIGDKGDFVRLRRLDGADRQALAR